KLPGLFALALALGWMAYRTNNIFTGALAHAVNNGSIVIALYLSPQLSTNASSSLVGTEGLSGTEALAMLALVIPLLAGLLYWFKHVTAPISARGNAEHEMQERLAQHTTLTRPDWTNSSNEP